MLALDTTDFKTCHP